MQRDRWHVEGQPVRGAVLCGSACVRVAVRMRGRGCVRAWVRVDGVRVGVRRVSALLACAQCSGCAAVADPVCLALCTRLPR